MTGRRSERSRKAINYSKFSADRNESDRDDDDDFMESTPPSKKKKVKRSQDSTINQNKEKRNEQKSKDRKSRNRLSEEEKYQLQIEEALKMSLADNETAKPDAENIKKTSQESSQSLEDTPTSCVVQAEVLDSPNTKLVQNSNHKKDMEIRKEAILNEAAQSKDDEIVPEPAEENKETGRRKSGRTKNAKEKEEEDYDMSSESESEDELSVDEESDFSDYVESPKKKAKTKKQTEPKGKKPAPTKKAAAPKKTSVSSPVVKQSLKGKENKLPPVSVKRPAPSKPCPPKTLTAVTALPKTPKSSTSSLPRRSPLAVPNPGKFVQRGWTPPRPAGMKADVLKSPQSPNFIRVGLSRNARLTPLHPKINIK